MLVVLLSVLGLTASAHSVFDAANNQTLGPDRSTRCSCGRGRDNHSPAKDFSASEQLAHRLNRRAGIQQGEGRFPVPVVDFGTQFVQRQGPPIVFDGADQSPGLARTWQFHWRTASEPRAPSTFS